MTTSPEQPAFISYRKSRFSTRLPVNRLYTRGHFWLEPLGDDVYRVGLTKFATRMLGDLVETGFEVEPSGAVALGQVIGWVECLKAASDLFCVMDGAFIRNNPDLDSNPEWLQKDPYGKSWLYEAQGEPDPGALDAQGYSTFLDETIRKMLGEEEA